MAERPRGVPSVILPGAVLLAAAAFYAAVLLVGIGGAARLAIGAVVLLALVWASARLGVAWSAAALADEPRPQRRFFALRELVNQFIDEVRRLNWLAAIGDEGFQSEDDARREMDAVEKRMHGIITQIRAAAGKGDVPESVGDTQPGGGASPEA